MKWLLLTVIMAVMLGGCAGPALRLDIDKTAGPDATSKVRLETRYELENGGKVTYNSETKSYEIDLASATTKDTDAGAWSLVAQMLDMIMRAYMPGIQAPPPQPDGG